MTAEHQPTVCCDFDGTICEWAFPDIGAPRENVIEALRELKRRGWQIVVHTCRVNSHWPEPERTEKSMAMVEWLDANDIPYDDVWGMSRMNVDGVNSCWVFTEWDVGKPVADAYLDDRAVPVWGESQIAANLVNLCEWCRSRNAAPKAG